MYKPSEDQIRAFVERHFEYRERKSGDELIINNPFDGDEGFHFNISVRKGICHDWRGNEWAKGRGKTFLNFVRLYLNCNTKGALEALNPSGTDIASIMAKMKRRAKESQEEGIIAHLAMPDGAERILENKNKAILKPVINWLKRRGIDERKLEKYDLHYQGTSVIWPYFEHGEFVYWQQRQFLNKSFLFPDENIGVTKGEFLYGFDHVEINEYVAITEAIFCTMTLEDQCLASGGAILTEKQVQKLKFLNPKQGVILAPDNDSAGIKSIVDNYKLLRPYFDNVFCTIPPKIVSGHEVKDWNEIGEKTKDWGLPRELFNNNIRRVDESLMVHLAGIS